MAKIKFKCKQIPYIIYKGSKENILARLYPGDELEFNINEKATFGMIKESSYNLQNWCGSILEFDGDKNEVISDYYDSLLGFMPSILSGDDALDESNLKKHEEFNQSVLGLLNRIFSHEK